MSLNLTSCIFILFIFYFKSYSQDLIIKKDSSKIFCKIIKENNSVIYYHENKDEKHLELNINKSEVLKYFNSGAIAQAKKTKLDSIKHRRDSIEDAKRPKSIYYNIVFHKGDTILITKSGELKFKDSLLKITEVLDLMRHDTSACKEMQKAKSTNESCFSTLVVGGVVGASTISFAHGITLIPALVATAGILVITYSIAIPLRIKYKKQARKAVGLFNEKHR